MKNFEEWLQEFDLGLHIEEVINKVINEEGRSLGRRRNPDVEILYWRKKRLCTIPKGLKKARDWNISDKRQDSGYKTSDNIAHRSLSGIGTHLLMNKIITPQQFIKHFLTGRNKEYLYRLQQRGVLPKTKSGIII